MLEVSSPSKVSQKAAVQALYKLVSRKTFQSSCTCLPFTHVSGCQFPASQGANLGIVGDLYQPQLECIVVLSPLASWKALKNIAFVLPKGFSLRGELQIHPHCLTFNFVILDFQVLIRHFQEDAADEFGFGRGRRRGGGEGVTTPSQTHCFTVFFDCFDVFFSLLIF